MVVVEKTSPVTAPSNEFPRKKSQSNTPPANDRPPSLVFEESPVPIIRETSEEISASVVRTEQIDGQKQITKDLEEQQESDAVFKTNEKNLNDESELKPSEAQTNIERPSTIGDQNFIVAQPEAGDSVTSKDLEANLSIEEDKPVRSKRRSRRSRSSSSKSVEAEKKIEKSVEVAKTPEVEIIEIPSHEAEQGIVALYPIFVDSSCKIACIDVV